MSSYPTIEAAVALFTYSGAGSKGLSAGEVAEFLYRNKFDAAKVGRIEAALARLSEAELKAYVDTGDGPDFDRAVKTLGAEGTEVADFLASLYDGEI